MLRVASCLLQLIFASCLLQLIFSLPSVVPLLLPMLSQMQLLVWILCSTLDMLSEAASLPALPVAVSGL